MTKTELFKFFHDLAIVPVVKIDDAAKAVPLAKAMIKGGINTAEITFRTDAAEEAIRRISEACPEMVVGAGTVINPSLAEKAVKAGAQFIVSAGLNPETVRWCNEHDVPCCPGVCTPSEIEMGLSLGLDTLKFFPAGHPDAPEVYQGERSAEALTNWLNEKMGTLLSFCFAHSQAPA